MSNDIPLWTDKITAIVAAAAFVISLASLYFSWSAKRLSDQQEKRRRPNLVPWLISGSYHTNEDSKLRLYAFHLSVSNPTDADNAIARLDLQLTYTAKTGVQFTIKLTSNDSESSRFIAGAEPLLPIPTRVLAHDTVIGWCYFRVDAEIIQGGTIESYKIIVTDTHQEVSNVEPVILQEYRDDIRR